MEDDRRFRSFFLGAGFSVPAGLPLGAQLWQAVLEGVDQEYGADNRVRSDLARFIEFKHSTTGEKLVAKSVDFEEFAGYLDIEHSLGLRGSDTWSESGNESQLIIRWFIGKLLYERQKAGIKRRPSVYRQFAERLRGGDYVFTFNYDTLLEESLEVIGRPYRLFPYRFESIGIGSNTVDTSRNDEEVVILKLHGSIDWFERSSYDNKVAHMRQLAEQTEPGIGNVYQGYEPPSPVFGKRRIVEPIPLVDGPRSEDDPLLAIYRVIDPAPLYRRGTGANPLLGAAPLLLTPSYQKLLYSKDFKDFWDGMGRGGGWSLGMGIIGFSLPLHDAYVLQVLYEFTGNYTGFSWNENFLGKLKLPLRLVDLQETEIGQENYRQRYRFCDWTRTESFFGGFNESAVNFLFEETRPVDAPSTGHSTGTST